MKAHFRVYVARKHVDDIPVWSLEEDGNGNALMFKTPTEAIEHARIVHKTTKKSVIVSHFINGERHRFWGITEAGHVFHEGRRTQQYRASIQCDCHSKRMLYCKHRMIIDAKFLKTEAA